MHRAPAVALPYLYLSGGELSFRLLLYGKTPCFFELRWR